MTPDGTRKDYDAVVVGSGPNGLSAAVRLAMDGHSVLVMEAADRVGGGTRSAELTFPGFTHDMCAAVHSLGVSAPALSLDSLGAHGLRWIWPDVPLAHPLDGGHAGLLHRSVDETADGLGADGSRYRRLMQPLVDDWAKLLPQLLGPVLSIPRHPLALARFGVRALQPATRLSRRFQTDKGAALFGGCAAHAMLSLARPLTSAFGLTLAASAHVAGWPIAAGGSQAVADALAARLRELGGDIETGSMVRTLADLPSHRVALFDTNPAQLASIAGDALPSKYRKRLRDFRHGPGAFKIDYALDAPVPWTNAACGRAGTVHVIGTLTELVAAEADVAAGRMPDRPFVLVVQPSIFDPSRPSRQAHPVGVRPCATRLHRRRDQCDRAADRTVRTGVRLDGARPPCHHALAIRGVQRELRRGRHRRWCSQRAAVDLPPDNRDAALCHAEPDVVPVLGVHTTGCRRPRHVRVARRRAGLTRPEVAGV